jgi:transcriptional regulator with XRE-family HTH domain
MKEKNSIFRQIFDWLYQHGMAIDQADIAAKTGISATTISRIMNHGVSRPDEKTIRKLNAAFGNIFNPDFLRGHSDKMLIDELSPDSSSINSNQQQLTANIPDFGSMTNALIAAKDDAIEALKRELLKTEESSKREIAAKDDAIEALKRELLKTEESSKREIADKEDIIRALRSELATKDAYIESLKQQIADSREQVADLRAALASQQAKDTLDNYPFGMGAAEDANIPQQKPTKIPSNFRQTKK